MKIGTIIKKRNKVRGFNRDQEPGEKGEEQSQFFLWRKWGAYPFSLCCRGVFILLILTGITSPVASENWLRGSILPSAGLSPKTIFCLPAGIAPYFGQLRETKEEPGSIRDESWMGIYIKNQKVGYAHRYRRLVSWKGSEYEEHFSESIIKVSRLGGTPLNIETRQSAFYNKEGQLKRLLVETTMSGDKIQLEAVVEPQKIIFYLGGQKIKEIPWEKEFYAEIPVKKLLAEGKIQPGFSQDFLIIDPLSYSLKISRFEVLGWEEVLILGRKKTLWHTRTKVETIIPVTVDDWLDEEGRVWKSINQSAFLTMTSLRQSQEEALRPVATGFELAYSSLIRSNIVLAHPHQVTRVRFRLSGVPLEKLLAFPFDDGSQQLVKVGDDFVIIQTNSLVFDEKRALTLPIAQETLRPFLESTAFCQSDDPEIQRVARQIVGSERNAWRAAKKIACWVNRSLTPNYDVGFATAREVIRNRQGDCSEHTVLMVALCRAVGLPARAAVGIMSSGGVFAYHMWPEVYVGRWVNLDPKWLVVAGPEEELVTDATHLKFGRSRLDEDLFQEMAQSVAEIIGQLKLEIIDYHSDPARQPWVKVNEHLVN
ncbi:MAG: hypothetical protein DRI99_03645 [Candidatus Aminicenantes bacterium]|nr:MAG: hypothetical protein DRJ11_00750 [Candidatus Aminicenantes bacterium]RLE04677.1 MAG: hypothetical protein DRI99_03645 [Candidatus Aminicenantes bacterium]